MTYSVFKIDLRSLALMRLAVGFSILIDLAVRIPDFRLLYMEDGIFPRAEFFRTFGSGPNFSLYNISGEAPFTVALFLFTTIVAVTFFMGYRAKLSAFLLFILLHSLHFRNTYALYGGDAYLRALLLWCAFCPIGERFSVDAARSGTVSKHEFPLRGGPLVLCLQIISLYFISALWKWGPHWTSEGSALFFTLLSSTFGTDVGRKLLAYPELLRALSPAVTWMELLTPVLILFGFFYARMMIVVVGLFLVFHASHLILLKVGRFPLISMSACLVFLPALWWSIVPSLENRLNAYAGRWSRWPIWPIKECDLPIRKMGLLLTILFSLTFYGNLVTFEYFHFLKNPMADEFTQLLGLDQRWAMFAPPPLNEGYFRAPARLENGSEVNALYGFDTYATHLRTKFFKQIWNKRPAEILRRWSLTLCNDWNISHSPDERIKKLSIEYVIYDLALTRQNHGPTETVKLWTVQCPSFH